MPLTVLTALLACLVMTYAWGQATATPKDTDPNLIFDLLGTVNSFEATLPATVKHAYLVAVQGDAALLEATREAGVEGMALTVAAGALAEVTGCSVLLFADLEFATEDGISGNRSTRCLPPEDEKQVRPTWEGPLATLNEPLELPLDRWLAVEAFVLEAPDAEVDWTTVANNVVFYLFLSTNEADETPELPGYASWDELLGAFAR